MTTIFISGGTGFIGRALCKKLLEDPKITKVISYSRRWNDSEALAKELNDPRFRVINGDICDWMELRSALKGVDRVIHTAAFKGQPQAEYSFFECKRVNIDGTENLINAAIWNGVKRVLFISSDKACAPINTYGRTKALGESLIINANNLGETRFSVARYGNVLGSTGSVLPFFKSILDEDLSALPITNPAMTRFWFKQARAVSYVIICLDSMIGGETFVPQLQASTIGDLVTALEHKYYTTIKQNILGMRPGEKMHEAMISEDEAWRTVELPWTYIIRPFQHDWDKDWDILGNPVKFTSYTSATAPRMKLRELMEAIK